MSDIVEVKDFTNKEQIALASVELEKFIKEHKLSTKIANKEHAHVEAWQFAGVGFGLNHMLRSTEKLSDDKQRVLIYYKEVKNIYQGKTTTKDVPYIHVILNENEPLPEKSKDHKRAVIKTYFAYKAIVDIFKDGELISTGEASCSNLELKKLDFDEYSVLSMAETRAVGKAYRLKLGFIFRMAGYSPTPAEEMEEDHLKKETKDNRPFPSDKQWEHFKKRFSEGDDVLDEMQKHFRFTDDQQKWIDENV